MDLIKIGKYIAGKRKSLGMTQKQLAEKLGMSDKSVSKWERGVCLPDVSVYKELCSILGISLNEFLAGEDIAQENMIQKSETNIIEVIRDNIDKQKCLKVMKCILLVISICAVSVIGFTIYRLKKPQNYISPVAKDSIEMQTAELLAGPDGAFVYKFITTDEYKKLRLHIYRYESGKLSDQDKVEMGFEDIGSPKSGEIVMVPDFDNYVIKLIISGGGSRLSTEIPILENVENREYYGRTATEIKNVVDIRYDKQQPLIAFDKRIDVLATAIHAGLKATQLKDLDLAYAPPYSSAKDPVNMAGFMIDNIAKGTLKQWHLEDMDKISKDKNVVLLDVRTVGEFNRGHMKGFNNIPVDELRERISEIEKGKPVYLICQSGLRSYIASRILEGNGYETYNFSGGFRFYDAVVNDRALIERAYACGMDC